MGRSQFRTCPSSCTATIPCHHDEDSKKTQDESGMVAQPKPSREKEKNEEQRDIFFGEEQPLKGYEKLPKWIDGEDKRPPLEEGSEIVTELNKYRIVKRLGNGGFGDVYAVRRATDGALLTLKEKSCSTRSSTLLVARIPWQPTTSLDRGHNPWFKFLMPYTGKSLDMIREKVIKREFQKHTAIKIAYQTHIALKNMHGMGYLHRDIKLDNFVVGKEYHRNKIYIMDFGMATNYNEEETKKQSEYGFIGTDKYAVRAVHEGLVAHRHDDMESLLYTMMDTFGTGYVPWEYVNSKDNMFFLKNRFFSGDFDLVAEGHLPETDLQAEDADRRRQGTRPAELRGSREGARGHDQGVQGQLVCSVGVDHEGESLTITVTVVFQVAEHMNDGDWNDDEGKAKKGKK